MFKTRSAGRLLYSLLALSLSTGLAACGPAPNTGSPEPSASSPAGPSSLPVSPPASPSASAGAPTATALLKLRIKADAALAGFATQQVSGLTLCLAQIARAETTIGTSSPVSRNLSLQDLLAGIEIALPALTPGPLEGRTSFFNAAGVELGFVSWQATLGSGGGQLTIELKPTAETHAGDSCPRIGASVSGATFLGAGGQVVGTQPLPNPVTTPSPEPSASPAGQAPGAPLNLQLVEQTSTSLTLQWDFHPDARSHKLYLDGQLVASDFVSPNYYRFEGLSPSTSYRLGVQSVNSSGVSEIVSLASATIAQGHSASGNFSGGGSSRRDADEVAVVGEFTVAQSEGERELNLLPRVASDADGDFVVVWMNINPGDLDIVGQRYSSQGAKRGSEFIVNTLTGLDHFDPDVAMDGDGNFVVTWGGYNDASQDAYILARRYDRAGRALDAQEFEVYADTNFDLDNPRIACNDDGSFVVAWEIDSVLNEDDEIFARSFTGNEPLESAFRVNTYTVESQSEPDVAMDEDGNFVVVWQSSRQDIDEVEGGIYARHFDAEGVPLTSEIHVNTYTASSQSEPALAMDDDGNYAVVWSSSDASEDELEGIFARRFAAGGAPRDNQEFHVNTVTEGIQHKAQVAMDADGDFVVSWLDFRDLGDPTNKYGITGQRFAADGGPQDDPFRISSPPDDDSTQSQDNPAMAMDAAGNFVVVWMNLVPPPDPEFDIKGRRFNSKGKGL
ncbi:MAG: hypothetical protein ACAI44_04840 [Candidatus Sericytochromatia bacterium]